MTESMRTTWGPVGGTGGRRRRPTWAPPLGRREGKGVYSVWVGEAMAADRLNYRSALALLGAWMRFPAAAPWVGDITIRDGRREVIGG